jgi:hypothetical protein
MSPQAIYLLLDDPLLIYHQPNDHTAEWHQIKILLLAA